MTDVNGPEGGLDIVCRIRLRLAPSGTLGVSDLGGDAYGAIDGAAERVGCSISRRVARALNTFHSRRER